MHHGIEVLGSDRRKNGELHAFVCLMWIADIVGATVNRHVMTTRGKTRAKLFCKSLEPTIIRRNAARAEDGQFHRVRIIEGIVPFVVPSLVCYRRNTLLWMISFHTSRRCFLKRSSSSRKWSRWSRRALINRWWISSRSLPARDLRRSAAR